MSLPIPFITILCENLKEKTVLNHWLETQADVYMRVYSPGPMRSSLPEPCVTSKLAQISEARVNKNTTAYKANLSIIFKPLAISRITRSTMIISCDSGLDRMMIWIRKWHPNPWFENKIIAILLYMPNVRFSRFSSHFFPALVHNALVLCRNAKMLVGSRSDNFRKKTRVREVCLGSCYETNNCFI